MIVAAIASLAALAGAGLVHEVHAMNPAERFADHGPRPRGYRRVARATANLHGATALRPGSATDSDR
ncbi:MAG: hypothetical protein ACO3C1_02685 [Ilumatobacteraceae bacterium]